MWSVKLIAVALINALAFTFRNNTKIGSGNQWDWNIFPFFNERKGHSLSKKCFQELYDDRCPRNIRSLSYECAVAPWYHNCEKFSFCQSYINSLKAPLSVWLNYFPLGYSCRKEDYFRVGKRLKQTGPLCFSLSLLLISCGILFL